MGNTQIREINIGRLTGLSSYELAVKHGYTGTEEEYVAKETAVYNDMRTFANTFVAQYGSAELLHNNITSRLNDLGNVESVDDIFTTFFLSDNIHMSDDKLTYSCTNESDMYIGMETDTNGVQLRMGWINGLQFRIKRNNTWSDWKSMIAVNPDREVE